MDSKGGGGGVDDIIPKVPRQGKRCPCRDGGVGEIVPGFAKLHRDKRDLHIDPPTSSNAIMQRPISYCGENSEPDRNKPESLTSNPELENSQGQKHAFFGNAKSVRT
jgi:hypothetical protein